MRGPGNDDERIKSLLLSGDSREQERGLILLDGAYRAAVSGHVRAWSDSHGVPLSSDDVADVWQNTLLSVHGNVQKGAFRRDGELFAYLCTIARRRAVDILRRRVPEYEDAVEEFSSAGTRCPECEVLEEVQACVDKLPEKYQVVMECDVRLFFRYDGWPPLDALIEEVNRNDRPDVSSSTVISRRRRGRERLQILLNERELK